jgi:hypothetical protein
MFENRLLKRLFELKSNEVTGAWRKLYNEELVLLYPSRSIIRMIRSRRVRWEKVARFMENRNAYRILVGKPVRINH